MSLENRFAPLTAMQNSDIEKEILYALKEKLKSEPGLLGGSFDSRQDYREKLYSLLKNLSDEKYMLSGFTVTNDFLDRVLSEIFGLGIIEKYISDNEVTDIFIQDQEMLVIKNGVKVYLGEVFKNMDEVYLLIDRIKFNSGKTVDQRVPFLNTDLYDGSRCQVVIPPVSDRVYITVRVFNCLDFSIKDLYRLGMFDGRMMDLLKDRVRNRRNILIAGSMGSGNTTLLNTLAKLIPETEIINIIQDLPEIKLKKHPYVRMLTTRPKSREIDNEISQDKLVFETLRMKADRIIVGEVRDYMASYQMLQALNTGHRGSFSTIHADSGYDALLRLETLAMEYRYNLSDRIVKKIVARAIDTVVFLEYEKDADQNIKNRKIREFIDVGNRLDERGEYRLEYL